MCLCCCMHTRVWDWPTTCHKMAGFSYGFLRAVLLFSFTVFILSPAVCLIYQSGLTCPYSPPFLLLSLLLISVSKSLLFHGKWKKKEWGSCMCCATETKTETAINDCSLHAQAATLVIPTMAMYTNSIVCRVTFSRISLKPGGGVTEPVV